MRRPNVYVIHEQLKRDGATGKMRRAFDTRPAEKWGARQIIFEDAASHMRPCDAFQLAMEKLADIQPEDYLLFCGAPELISTAIVVAADRLRGSPLNVLVWSKGKVDYEVRTITREGREQ